MATPIEKKSSIYHHRKRFIWSVFMIDVNASCNFSKWSFIVWNESKTCFLLDAKIRKSFTNNHVTNWSLYLYDGFIVFEHQKQPHGTLENDRMPSLCIENVWMKSPLAHVSTMKLGEAVSIDVLCPSNKITFNLSVCHNKSIRFDDVCVCNCWAKCNWILPWPYGTMKSILKMKLLLSPRRRTPAKIIRKKNVFVCVFTTYRQPIQKSFMRTNWSGSEM